MMNRATFIGVLIIHELIFYKFICTQSKFFYFPIDLYNDDSYDDNPGNDYSEL